MNLKKENRKKRIRFKICKKLKRERICVNKTSKHIYAQVVSADGKKVLVSASTLEKDIKKETKNMNQMEAAKRVGVILANRAKCVKNKASFDRSGFKYHGRIKEVATGARKCGLIF
uniref:Large ribosomal subunit protein uL18 n=1 Tax=Candidatus Portiera aleyrodidarum TaxID=91844 RepID=Q7WZS1_9GAMM|nr:ribosomal protein L18 [Candidatus Portiera aleyrodidarum]